MNAEDSKDNEVVTTGDNGVNDNNNSNTLVAESPSEKKDINSAGTAEPAAKNSRLTVCHTPKTKSKQPRSNARASLRERGRETKPPRRSGDRAASKEERERER